MPASIKKGEGRMEKEKWSENKDIKQIQWLFLTFVGFCGMYAMAELVNFYGLLFWGW